MKTAGIVLAIFVGLTLFVMGIKGIMMLEAIATDLSQPVASVTTIEYLKITNPEGVSIEIKGLHSEMDTRLLLLAIGKGL